MQNSPVRYGIFSPQLYKMKHLHHHFWLTWDERSICEVRDIENEFLFQKELNGTVDLESVILQFCKEYIFII